MIYSSCLWELFLIPNIKLLFHLKMSIYSLGETAFFILFLSS